MAGFDLKDYVDVAERIRAWYEAHPEGRITTDVIESTDKRVAVRAEAYRNPQDNVPAGVGHSALAIPGATPYTRGSELENAETSAVGRALVMAGLPSKRVASADEVQAKQGDEGGAQEAYDRAVAAVWDDSMAPADPQPAVVKAAMDFAAQDDDAMCPQHRVAWTHKPAGVSKVGKPYGAFFACSQKNSDGSYCKMKPSIRWASGRGA